MWMYQFKLYFNRFCFWSQSFLQLQKIWRNEVTWYVNKSCPNCLYIHVYKIYCIKVHIHSIHIYSFKEQVHKPVLNLIYFCEKNILTAFSIIYINFTYWRILYECVCKTLFNYIFCFNCDICNTFFIHIHTIVVSNFLTNISMRWSPLMFKNKQRLLITFLFFIKSKVFEMRINIFFTSFLLLFNKNVKSISPTFHLKFQSMHFFYLLFYHLF